MRILIQIQIKNKLTTTAKYTHTYYFTKYKTFYTDQKSIIKVNSIKKYKNILE